MNQSFYLTTGSRDEAEAIQNTYQKAQHWCNFVLLQPAWFPADLIQVDQSLRSEQAEHASSYRIVAKGLKRALSIKQFLFDFAPPAYDHPSLWRNPKTTQADEFPSPQPYPLGDNIFWIGHDHRKMPAATLGLHRVRVEITVLDGAFSKQELVEIAQNLTPTDKDYAQELQKTPFALLSYQRRHAKNASNVPLSYWRYQRKQSDKHLAKLPSEASIELLNIQPPDLSQFGYTLDSIFLTTQEEGKVNEIDVVYEAKQRNGAYVRLLVSPPESEKPIPYPAEIYTQACKTTLLTIGNKKIYQAWHTDDFGAFEANFQYNGHNALLLAQPAAWTNQDWFMQLLEHIVKK